MDNLRVLFDRALVASLGSSLIRSLGSDLTQHIMHKLGEAEAMSLSSQTSVTRTPSGLEGDQLDFYNVSRVLREYLSRGHFCATPLILKSTGGESHVISMRLCGWLPISSCFEDGDDSQACGSPCCSFIAGLLKTFLENVYGLKMDVHERSCYVRGGECCEFFSAPRTRCVDDV